MGIRRKVEVWSSLIPEFESFCVEHNVSADLMPSNCYMFDYYVIFGDLDDVIFVTNYLNRLYEDLLSYDDNIVEYVSGKN